MAERTPVAQRSLVAGDQRPEISWDTARERLENPEHARTNWLATVHTDGRPHLRPLIGIWLDGAFYFLTGEKTRKGIDLRADPRCVIATSSTQLPALDLIMEGEATKVTDETELRRLVDVYGSKLRWPLELRDGEIFGPNAPTAGPPPYAFFKLVPATTFGFPGLAGSEETRSHSVSPTRWRFAEDGGHT
jgi:hypothetical protein